MRTVIGLFFLGLIATGCGPPGFQLVEPGEVTVGKGLIVRPARQWSSVTFSERQLWTVDSPGLQTLNLIGGLAPGRSLFEPGGANEDSGHVFRANMSASEVMELVADSIAADSANLATSDLQPFSLGGVPGFRFTLSYQSESGLDYRGLCVGAVHDERLYLMLYTGTAQVYFERYRNDVERLAESARIL
ncbi:MAG: hypothetical protein ACR2RL_02370 [Gammaproteobacteria bacterium]